MTAAAVLLLFTALAADPLRSRLHVAAALDGMVAIGAGAGLLMELVP
jgi:hypothetical protein